MTTPPPDAEVRDNPGRSRYELLLGDRIVGVADYQRLPEDTILLSHTEVAPELRGKGYSPILVRWLLDDLAARGLGIVPSCWYVAEFMDGHPEYAALRRG